MEGADGLLAARLAAGDDRALAEAFDRLGSAVYGAALRVLGEGSAAQDVVQDVFVDLWRHPHRYDPAAGALRAYLTARARHRAVDLVRSELRRIARQERHHRLGPVQARPSACQPRLCRRAGRPPHRTGGPDRAGAGRGLGAGPRLTGRAGDPLARVAT